MIKASAKIISIFAGIAVAGTVTAVAATANNHMDTVPAESVITSQVSSTTSSAASSVISSAASAKANPSSAAATSKGVNKVADGVNQIQQATDNGVSQIHDATSKAVSQIQADQKAKDALKTQKAARLKKEMESQQWDVIDPDSGEYIGPNDSRYESIKAKLGGDAGTVNPDKSTACQKAAKQAQQKIAEQYKAEQEKNKMPHGNNG